jgi:hypothetical protein
MPKTDGASAGVKIDRIGNCPACNASWDAGSIFETLRPQEWCAKMSDAELRDYVREHYGEESARFSRLIGIEVRGVYDGVLLWECPDCQKRWRRF